MHVVLVLAGLVALTALSVAAGWSAGFSALALIGLAAGILVAGQVVYLLFVAAMARAEAARRRLAADERPQSEAAETTETVHRGMPEI